MDETILTRLRDECVSLALAGKHADTGALRELLPGLEDLGRSSRAFLEAARLAREVTEGMPDSLLPLIRVIFSMIKAGAGFAQGMELAEPSPSPAFYSPKQIAFRELSQMRATLEACNASTDRLLSALSSDTVLFDFRLLPIVISLSCSERLSTSRLASVLLSRLSNAFALEASSPAPPDAQIIRQARIYISDGNVVGLEKLLQELTSAPLLSKPAYSFMCELLKSLPLYKKHPLIERAVICSISGQQTPDALRELEDYLMDFDEPRAVFGLALKIYMPSEFYSRYYYELDRCREHHYKFFRDAVICHIMCGGSVDSRWSDYFATKRDRLPTAVTVGPGNARALAYLKSFPPTTQLPDTAELMLNIALIPQTLLRMDIYDFWDELWEYLAISIQAHLQTGGVLNDAFFNDQIIFTLSLNGEWITDRLSGLSEAYACRGELQRLIDLISEKSMCYK